MDSIFHFFSPAPFDEAAGGLRFSPRRGLSVRLAYTRRDYRAGSGGDGAGWSVDGVDLDGRVTLFPGARISLLAGYEDGAVGRRWMVAPRFAIEVADRRVHIDGRGYLLSFEDPVQDNQHALTIGCSAAVNWHFGKTHALMLMADLNGNRFHPLELRLFMVVDLAFHYTSRRGTP
jgi:hypothetical protein